jgi:N-methylhydantoinase A/oxoprolinase/acetone carboxylase beta subunit
LSKHVFDQYDEFNEIVDGFTARAESDFADEGHPKTNINYQLELDVRSGSQIYVTTVKSPVLRIESRDDLAEVLRSYFAEYADRFGEFALTAEVGVSVETVRLRATIDQSRWSPQQAPVADQMPAPKAHRECYWPSRGDFESTPIYRYEEFSPGNQITGPAILEGADTTVVVYPKWRAEMNESGFLAIDRLEEL